MTNESYDDEIDLREYLEVILKKWKTIALVTLFVAIAALFYSFRQPLVYEAKTTLLFRSGGGGNLSQYAGMASMLGVNLGGGGGGGAGDITELLKSKVVAAKVLDDLDLTKRIKGWDNPKLKRKNLVLAVRGMLKPPKMNGNILELKVEANEPQLAADVADGFISAIEYYWNELNFTETQKKLKYIEQELPRVEKDLKVVEDKLKLVPLSSVGSPLGGGQSGLQRDYEIYNSIYTMLRREKESNKLEASKEIPPFSVVDKAEKPESKSRPRTKLNVMIGVALGLFAGVFFLFIQEYWHKIAAN
ncbi:MAG: Wzz/FepE/Etk N-terminal domain-containing protein [bacterium]